MLARFFIDRPVFAAVISIVIVIAGGVAALTLPIAEFPDVAPPSVVVSTFYPGASAEVVADTIAAPIEQQVNGVEGMMYMSSNNANDGSYTLTVTFRLGTDPNIDQVLTQNRVALALPQLPSDVQRIGISTKKRAPDILLVVSLLSPDHRYDQLFLSNYATIQIRDELSRLDGVGDVIVIGQQDYSMRVWLNPEIMFARGLTTQDVINAVREQNVQVAAGQIGQPPIPPGQKIQMIMRTLGRLVTAEQFADIIVKTGSGGQVTRLRDIARVELSARSQDQAATLDGQTTAGLAIFQLPGSNALAVANEVRAKMEELKNRFPAGIEYRIIYDTTPFIRESIIEVFRALRDAIILVAIVVIVFLQSWRASLIPLISIPVSLIGTFAIMAVSGFGLNQLTLFGMVLAVGIVVDDAIVVVENVERWIERGLPPKEAAYRSMEEVTVAVIAIAFGLSAIFVPTAFLPGIPGHFFRQFALTIATATLISALNSLTLSPALSAIVLKPQAAPKDWLQRVIDAVLGWFFRGFERTFEYVREHYRGLVGHVLKVSGFALLVYVALLAATYIEFRHVPLGFIPSADQGYLLVNIQLPDDASLERTQRVVQRMNAIARSTPGIAHTHGVAGQSFLAGVTGSNLGTMFIILEPFERRTSPALHAPAIEAALRQRFFAEIPQAIITVFPPVPVRGIGTAGGIKLIVENRGSTDLPELQTATDNLVASSNRNPGFVSAFTPFRAETPQLYLDIDRTKCKMRGLALDDVFNTLQTNLGGYYANDFNRFGRTWQVNLAADAPFRRNTRSLTLLNIRNNQGQMIPLTAVADVSEISGPAVVTRYNMYPAAAVNLNLRPGVSSGQGMQEADSLATRLLPPSMAHEWTEIAYLEQLAGYSAILIFPLCVLFVFLAHSAEYESFSLPLGIILVVPLSLFFGLAGVWLRGLEDNLITQIGFVVLAGLATKNSVLIIEFAKQQHEKGLSPRDAAIEASRLRLRPILMTSFAFILGVVPLVIASGAGAELRQALGIAVFAGMIGVTFIGLFLTPVFYYVIQTLVDRRWPPAHVATHP